MLPLTLLIMLSQPDLHLQSKTRLQIPESSEFFLQNPLSFDIDAQGRIYLVDGEAKTIFVWKRDGSFLRTFGKPGQGPGEFTFSGHGPAIGFICCVGDRIFVFDGMQKKVSEFDENGQYLSSPNLNLPRSRSHFFWAIDEDTFLMLNRSMMEDHFASRIESLDRSGKTLKMWKEVKDDSVSFSMKDGRSRMTFKAYNPELLMAYRHSDQTLYLALTGEPFLTAISPNGEHKTIQIKLTPKDVTEHDKDEFLLSRNGNRTRTPTFVFPDTLPYFQKILPLESGQLLIVLYDTPFTHKIQAIKIEQNGTILGKLDTKLGEGGALLASRGQLMRCRLNKQAEFECDLVKLEP